MLEEPETVDHLKKTLFIAQQGHYLCELAETMTAHPENVQYKPEKITTWRKLFGIVPGPAE